ncbi:hypothetical protein, partial [Enterobacter bugandensis]|uniref:hypothetical protein n=1 Tax=Enterobacter bugandensis TaxID=881260 RepID=UPI0029D8D518
APRPGLQETPQRFTAGPGHRCKLFIYLKQCSSLQEKITGDSSAHREREKTLKTTTLLSFCFYLGRHKKTGHSPGFYV